MILEAAHRLVQLCGDPHPGLMTWNAMTEEAYQDLKQGVELEESKRDRKNPGRNL